MNPFKIKKGLGRGLSSLIGDSGISKSQTKISIGSIVKNKFQPRKIFNNDDFKLALEGFVLLTILSFYIHVT